MTAQAPERFESEYSGIDFSGLELYRVVTGFTRSDRTGQPYPLMNRPKAVPESVSSNLWRGHRACYRLTRDGRLLLEAFEYPKVGARTREQVSETLQGEFWLVLGDSFFGSRTYVPFPRWNHRRRSSRVAPR